MSATVEGPEILQTFRMPGGELEIRAPEPFFFVVKLGDRKFSDQELNAIDAANEHLRIETNADGDFEIMPPPYPETSRKDIAIDGQLWVWTQRDETGVCFESSAKFTLHNGAKRLPDAAWILKDRYYAFLEKDKN